MNPPEIITPRISLLNEEARRAALQNVIATQKLLTPDVINDLIERFKRASQTLKDGFGVTTPQMMEIADDFPPAVKKLVRGIIRRRHVFPKYVSIPGLFQLDQLESMLKWYERKSQHRIQMIDYAGDLDIMSTYALQQYIMDMIVPSLERLTKDFYKTAFCLMCTEGVLMCCPSSRPNFISIKKLLASTVLDEIDEAAATSDPSFDEGGILKWFSVQNVYVILHHFRIMDEESKGMLSYEDFFRIGYLNPAFIQGFWNSPKCYKFAREVIEGDTTTTVVETDLSGLICFERAVFNITTFCNEDEKSFTCPMEYDSVLYFVFRCLSENYEDYWTMKHFRYIVNCLRTALIELDQQQEDFLEEDMVNIFINYLNPKDQQCITFADVKELDNKMRPGNKSSAALFLGMLVDAGKFRAYDNRESVS